MSYEKRIHDYLGGELSPEEEHQFFDDLSEHPEWRDELTLQMKMQQAAQKDIGSVVVPTAATSAIFSALSFASPDQINNSTSTPASILGQKALSRFGLFAISTATAAIIAVGCLVYILVNSSTKETISSQTNKPQEALLPQPETELTHSLEVVPSPLKPVPSVSQAEAVDRNKNRISAESITPHTIANEPMKVYLDIGRFSSVDYLTQRKIIGVADGGKIYCSEDGGHSWAIQSSGTSSDLFGVNFIDSIRGIVVGANGTILTTTTAGHEWHSITSGIDANLITVRFATQDTVYACGSHGVILRSTSSGEQWQLLESGIKASLFKIRFEDGANGVVSGEHNIALETHNAGATWLLK